jgi:exodeoxyribonuclease VII large subunit
MSQKSFLQLLMDDRQAMTVSELTARIKIQVEGEFFDVWVEGEISNFRLHSSGHWYFTLKDEGAMLRCASFRMQNRLIRFTPEDGLTVKARGRLSLYEARGEYQLLVEYLEPVGAGALQLAFEQLKNRLAAEGLFEAERKRPIPLMPRRIGVVTSATGAALRDILRVLGRRNRSVSVLVAPARVQGEGAAREIADSIQALNEYDDIDVIIVGRGGGSIEDLWPFNEELVARAIFNSRVPIISAVGHETDFTIADFVADLRASTPSAAAELATIASDEAYGRIGGLNYTMAQALRMRLMELRSQVSDLESSRAFDTVQSRIHSLRQRFDSAIYISESAIRKAVRRNRAQLESISLRLRDTEIRRNLAERRGRLAVLGTRLNAAARDVLQQEGEKFSVAASKLSSLSPLGVLARGYAIAFDSEGQIVKRANDLRPGDRLRLRVAEGEVDCTVD